MEVNGNKMPEWLPEMLEKLREIEISLGSLLPEKDQARTVDLSDWIANKNKKEIETLSESLFAEICKKLNQDGVEPTTIVEFVNKIVRGQNTTMPYCNLAEVKAVLVP